MKTEDKERMREDMHGYLDKAMDKLEDKYEKVNVRVNTAREKTGKFVRDNYRNPVFLAASVGTIAALLAMGLMKRKKKCPDCNQLAGMGT